MGRRLKGLVALVAILVVAVGGGVVMGVLGTPAVESVENRFAGVSAETTTIETDLTVSNPNPIGVQLGGVAVNYTVSMNDVQMAHGDKDGLELGEGSTTLSFSTTMQNDRIPAWWYTHIENGETSTVTVDAEATSSTLGGRSVSFSRDETIETDIVSQFNSTETRPVNADRPLVDDPILYVNETRGSWDQANLTREETPLDLGFDVYNPKSYPYTVSKVGYTIQMNDVTVGEGETDRGYVIGPGEQTTIDANTAIQNQNLDRWWVTHLQRNQRTDLYIDFYLVLEGGGQQFRVDLDAIDYEQEIETDIFGNKAEYPTGNVTAESGSDDANDDESTADGEMTATETPTETETDDGGLLGDGTTETATETETQTPTETETPTETATPTETETDDGGLLD